MTYYKCGSVYTTQNSNVVVDTASGAIANFQTPLAMPLLKTRFDFKAAQDLHGQSGAYPAGGGVNKFDKDTMVVSGYYIADTDGQAKPDSGSSCTDYVEINPNTSYYIKTEQTVGQWAAWYDENKDYISGFNMYNRVVTSPSTAKYIRLTILRSGRGNVDTFCINYPATDTAYHPYSNICPISGINAISVFRRGANLFDISTKTNDRALKWTDGDTFNDVKSIVSDYIEVKEGVKFSSNYFAQWCCYDKNKNYLGNIVADSLVKTSGNDTTINTIPSGYGVYYLRLGYRSALNNDEDMTQKTDIVLNVGNNATDFEPYSGNTEVINLGGTYYGGHFTQDKDGHRQFVVMHKRYDLSALSWQVHQKGYYYTTKPDNMYKYLSTEIPEWIAERYQKATGQWIYGHGTTTGYIGANGGLIYCTDSTTPSGYLVAPLTEPFTIALPDGQPINTLAGVNNFFADTGDTSLQFRKIG